MALSIIVANNTIMTKEIENLKTINRQIDNRMTKLEDKLEYQSNKTSVFGFVCTIIKYQAFGVFGLLI
jgi:hypothetical protein